MRTVLVTGGTRGIGRAVVERLAPDNSIRVLETALTARLLAVDLEGPKGARIVAMAGGPGKVAAVAAVLASGHLHGLITDEATARALLM